MTDWKQSDIGVIPTDWDVVPLGDLMDFRNGINADKAAYGRGIPFINVLEVITHSHITVDDVPGRVSISKSATNAYLVRRGDVLFNRTSETQEEVALASVYVGEDSVVFGGFVIRGRPVNPRLFPDFAGYMLRSAAVRQQIVRRGQGAIRANIGQVDLRQILVPLPPVPEQHAITESLQDADNGGQSLWKLIDKKRAIREGVLRELLTPSTRLKDCVEGWRTRPIGDVAQVVMGQSPSSIYYNTIGEGVPLIQGNLDIRGGRAVARVWTRRMTKACDAGDVLLTVRAPVGSVGVATERACLGRGVCALKAFSGEVDRKFLYFALVNAKSAWKALEQGSTFTAANAGQVAAFQLSVPDSLSEQRKIADVLSAIDLEIESLVRQAEKTWAVKDGVAQELISGRLRLPGELM